MSDSMREAVEGFERERAQRNEGWAIPYTGGVDGTVTDFVHVGEDIVMVDRTNPDAAQILNLPRDYFARADVLDLATAANDARQSAILTPDIAEAQEALADRLTNLAERLGALVPKEG